MGFLSDVLGFEKFHLKDLWGRIKDNPEKLLDPMVGGLVNPLGGPKGDVYDRASDAGIRVKSGRKMHDLAEAISSMYAGGYLMNQLPTGQGGQPGMQLPGMNQQQPEQPTQGNTAQKQLEDLLLARRYNRG
jgi:hypothetical protein